MLNNNKILSLINSQNLTDIALGNIIGKSPGTAKKRRIDGDWYASEIENLATYFNKPIVYFFDKENDPMELNEPGAEYRRRCLQCEEKDKKIIELQSKLLNLYENERGAELNGEVHDAVAS